MARAKAPRPHCSIMKPICEMVDHASERLMLGWVIMTSEPNRAVAPPTAARALSASGACTSSGLRRTMRKPPALIKPACIRADTGVGVSRVSGSQLWKGSCADFIRAAATTSQATQGSTAACAGLGFSAAANSSAKSQVPKPRQTRASAPIRQASPSLLMRNFLRAASAAVRLPSGKVSSRCRQRLVAVQQATNCSRLPATASSSTETRVAISARVKRAWRGSLSR